MCIDFWLAVELHAQSKRVGDNQRENDVLEWLRCDHPPDLVLESRFRDVTTEGFSFQSKFDTISLLKNEIQENKNYDFDCIITIKKYLIFIQFAVFVLLFSFILKGDDNETDKDIDHEEGNNNDVNKIEAGD